MENIDSKHKIYTVLFYDINRRVVLGAHTPEEAVESARETYQQVMKEEYNGKAKAFLCEDIRPNA